ncbi:MAG: cupredoxin domain-containing protein [Actinomycetota bacterium]|nr:cupredoxin domain-containing protein [Actinomycetota bacterium]
MSRGMIRTLILVPLLLIVLVALFLLLRPSSTTQESASTPESTGTQGADKTFDLAIKGASAMSPDQVSVNQGDHVNLRITSDEPLEFHLHGYDLEKELEANEPGELSFDATNAGRFGMEAHLNDQTHEELGDLLVQPR